MKTKVFMNKVSGEIALSMTPRLLWTEDDSYCDWCNYWVYVGDL